MTRAAIRQLCAFVACAHAAYVNTCSSDEIVPPALHGWAAFRPDSQFAGASINVTASAGEAVHGRVARRPTPIQTRARLPPPPLSPPSSWAQWSWRTRATGCLSCDASRQRWPARRVTGRRCWSPGWRARGRLIACAPCCCPVATARSCIMRLAPMRPRAPPRQWRIPPTGGLVHRLWGVGTRAWCRPHWWAGRQSGWTLASPPRPAMPR